MPPSSMFQTFGRLVVAIHFLTQLAEALEDSCKSNAETAAIRVGVGFPGFPLPTEELSQVSWGWAYPQFLLRSLTTYGVAVFDDWHQSLVWDVEDSLGKSRSAVPKQKGLELRHKALQDMGIGVSDLKASSFSALLAFRSLRHVTAHTASDPGPSFRADYAEILPCVLRCDREPTPLVPGSGHIELLWSLPIELGNAMLKAGIEMCGGFSALRD